MNGSVELVLLGVKRDEEGQPIVRKVAGSTAPSLYGTLRAAFSTVLDRHGAALMRSVIAEGGVTMALAIYHLTYAGIPPAYNLKITIDYQRVYDHLDLRVRAGVTAGSGSSSFVTKAGFHMLMEELKENRAIKVEEVDPIPGENGRTPTNQEMINEIIGNLMGSRWLIPRLGPRTRNGSLRTDGSASIRGFPRKLPARPAPTTSPSMKEEWEPSASSTQFTRRLSLKAGRLRGPLIEGNIYCLVVATNSAPQSVKAPEFPKPPQTRQGG